MSEPQKTSWWQFSLREMLLAMTAVGAILMLMIQNWPREPSSFFQRFDPTRSVNTSLTKTSLKGTSITVIGSANARTRASGHYDSMVHINGATYQDISEHLMMQLHTYIERELKEAGLGITGQITRGHTAKGSQRYSQLNSFRIRYFGGRKSGCIRVYANETSNADEIRLLFLLDES